MRELKFRAWDKVQGKYIEVVRMQFSVTRTPILITQELSDKQLLTDPASLYVIEQYTGLKDKNGEEIYEGDIVEEDIDFNSETTDGTFRYRVYWDECLLCWSLDPIGKESIHDELWQTNLSRRIIGNIHENPELLEEEG